MRQCKQELTSDNHGNHNDDDDEDGDDDDEIKSSTYYEKAFSSKAPDSDSHFFQKIPRKVASKCTADTCAFNFVPPVYIPTNDDERYGQCQPWYGQNHARDKEIVHINTTTSAGSGIGASLHSSISLSGPKDNDPLDQYRIQDMNPHHYHPSSFSSSSFSSNVNPPQLSHLERQPSPNINPVLDVVEIKISAFRNAIVAVKMILG